MTVDITPVLQHIARALDLLCFLGGVLVLVVALGQSRRK